jgi:hypothetical protein
VTSIQTGDLLISGRLTEAMPNFMGDDGKLIVQEGRHPGPAHHVPGPVPGREALRLAHLIQPRNTDHVVTRTPSHKVPQPGSVSGLGPTPGRKGVQPVRNPDARGTIDVPPEIIAVVCTTILHDIQSDNPKLNIKRLFVNSYGGKGVT